MTSGTSKKCSASLLGTWDKDDWLWVSHHVYSPKTFEESKNYYLQSVIFLHSNLQNHRTTIIVYFEAGKGLTPPREFTCGDKLTTSRATSAKTKGREFDWEWTRQERVFDKEGFWHILKLQLYSVHVACYHLAILRSSNNRLTTGRNVDYREYRRTCERPVDHLIFVRRVFFRSMPDNVENKT